MDVPRGSASRLGGPRGARHLEELVEAHIQPFDFRIGWRHADFLRRALAAGGPSRCRA